jgi:hypothetical protein
MQRDEVIAKLKQHEAELRRLGIEHLYLFGSTAHGGRVRILTPICSSTTSGASSVFSS